MLIGARHYSGMAACSALTGPVFSLHATNSVFHQNHLTSHYSPPRSHPQGHAGIEQMLLKCLTSTQLTVSNWIERRKETKSN